MIGVFPDDKKPIGRITEIVETESGLEIKACLFDGFDSFLSLFDKKETPVSDNHRFHIYEDSGQWPHVSCNDCSWSQALPSFDPTLDDIIDTWGKRPCSKKDVPEVGSRWITETGSEIIVVERTGNTVWFHRTLTLRAALMHTSKSMFLQCMKKVD